MKKILIYGVKVEPIGGVEKVVLSYAKNFDSEKIIADYVMFNNNSCFEKEINAQGGKVFYLPNRIKHRREYKAEFERIFKNGNYDAVWGNYSGLTNIDILKFGKKYCVPIRVAHSHGCALAWNGLLMRYLVPLFHYINKSKIKKYATDFWGCSTEAAQFMFPKSVYKKIKVINNAIDLSTFYKDDQKRAVTRKELGIENSFVIGHIARMSSEKNQFFMLDVFKEYLKTDNNAKLLLVGDGELMSELKSKAHIDGALDNILFMGFKENVADYHRAADVFLFPSLVEGLGLSLIEAQACGVPCVASSVVPKAADISGCVKFVDLEEPISVWCDAIKQMKYAKLDNPTEIVKHANYDIIEEAKKMCDFFITGDLK